MTTQITSSTGNFIKVQPVSPSKPHGEPRPDLNDILTPEQKNTIKQGANDKIAEQVESVTSNYQTAKDIDLMQSYYQQQQKLFDIYIQTSTDSNVENSTQNASTVSSLTKNYAELYQLHQNVKEGVVPLPGVELPAKGMNRLPENSIVETSKTSQSTNNIANQASSHKQINAYNSLMMPSTASYVHLSA